MHICEVYTDDGSPLRAVFNPEVGMNLMSYSLGHIEVIDQQTRPMFDERMAGLGALIGPHFHHRNKDAIPNIDVTKLFPFINTLVKKGQKEPFSHGIARYVPWEFSGDKSSIEATLSGQDSFKGFLLSEIEGQDFELSYKAKLSSDGLHIDYFIDAEKPSVIGLHYYYSLFEKKGLVTSTVLNQYHCLDGWREIPTSWLSSKKDLQFKIEPNIEADFGFRPTQKAKGQIELTMPSHQLCIKYKSDNDEHAWQLYHPKDATYVCIEPVSSQNPRDASRCSAHLKVHLQILKQ